MNGIERRGFLTFMSAAITGMLLPKLPESIVFDPRKLKDAGDMALPMVEFMREVERHFVRALGGWRLEYAPADMFPKGGAMVGDTIHLRKGDRYSPVMLRDQINVHMALPLQTDLVWRRRYAEPAGEMLARAVKVGKLTVLTDLALPVAPEVHACRISSKQSGSALRGVVQYEPGDDGYQLRVDLLGGA